MYTRANKTCQGKLNGSICTGPALHSFFFFFLKNYEFFHFSVRENWMSDFLEKAVLEFSKALSNSCSVNVSHSGGFKLPLLASSHSSSSIFNLSGPEAKI